MKILHLVLHKKWFDLIASGHKIIEYREVKDYWRIRLIDNHYKPNPEFREFEEIHFRNGYNKDSPFMRVKCLGITIVDGRFHQPCNGEVLKGMYFAIFLGSLLQVER